MKCELCQKADAETAITRGEGDDAEELYVCKACAKQERVKRQKRSQRTRKIVIESGGEPPPFIGAIINAFEGMVSDIEKVANGEAAEESENHEPKAEAPAEPKLHDFPTSRVDAAYRLGTRLHLEGLHLIGELEATRRALHALDMELTGVEADGIHDTGHVYTLGYAGNAEQAKRVVQDLLREERNARVRLLNEMPRVFGDSLCRALAVLKNCRLLSPGELFDLLSPLRLAAREKLLDGIGLKEIERLQLETDLTSSEDNLEPPERDRVDAERADEMNRLFEDVVLNEQAEEKFL